MALLSSTSQQQKLINSYTFKAPATAQASQYPLTFTIQDSLFAQYSETVTVNVLPAYTAPILTSTMTAMQNTGSGERLSVQSIIVAELLLQSVLWEVTYIDSADQSMQTLPVAAQYSVDSLYSAYIEVPLFTQQTLLTISLTITDELSQVVTEQVTVTVIPVEQNIPPNIQLVEQNG